MKNLYDDNNDENIKMIFNDAGDILIARMEIVFYNLQSMKLNDKKRLKDNYYKKKSDEIILKEKKLRKEFFNKYGF